MTVKHNKYDLVPKVKAVPVVSKGDKIPVEPIKEHGAVLIATSLRKEVPSKNVLTVPEKLVKDDKET